MEPSQAPCGYVDCRSFAPAPAPDVSIGPAFAAPIELSQNYAPGISLVKATGFVQPRPKGLGATLRHQFRCWSWLMIVQAMQPSECVGHS
jgi:hypothetical protein